MCKRPVGKPTNNMEGRRPDGNITDPGIRGWWWREGDRRMEVPSFMESSAQKWLYGHRWMDLIILHF